MLRGLKAFLDSTDQTGRVVGNAKCGVYAFYDYDDEPIYVGQTYEGLRTRIRRHLTNQRTDAVAMHVLDPMEVARVEVWPFWGLEASPRTTQRETLHRAEFTVYEKLTQRARVSKLLNEKIPAPAAHVDLPEPHSALIISDDVRSRLGHSDERIARRSATIANLAQVIKERDVSLGLRVTLVTQAERLQLLATQRLNEIVGQMEPGEISAETQEVDDDGDVS